MPEQLPSDRDESSPIQIYRREAVVSHAAGERPPERRDSSLGGSALPYWLASGLLSALFVVAVLRAPASVWEVLQW